MLGYGLRLVNKSCSKCSNLSFRPLNVGIVIDTAFGSLGSPMFCCVTFRSDSSSFRLYGPGICGWEVAGSMISAVFQFGGTLLSPCVDTRVGATRTFQLVGKKILDLKDQLQSFPHSTLQVCIFEDRFSIILSISLCPV